MLDHSHVELKIRPFSNPANQERADLKGASRIHVCREVLLDLKIESGKPCYVWKAGADPQQDQRSAIIWLTSEKTLSKKVVQVSRAFQEAYGLKLGDDLCIARDGSDGVPTALSLQLKDVSALEGVEVVDLTAEDRGHWEWYLKEHLGRAEVIFTGMLLKNIQLRGARRTFEVSSVNEGANSHAQYHEGDTQVAIIATADARYPEVVPAKLELTGIAGMDQAVNKLNAFLANFDRVFKYTWSQRSCAVVVHGSHGTGKSFLLDKVASCGWGKIHRVDREVKAPALRKVFQEAKANQPSIILLDDLDDVLVKDDTASNAYVNGLCESLDSLLPEDSRTRLPRVVVLASSKRLASLPLCLRKRGRFRTDIALEIPDVKARKAILRSLLPPIAPDLYDATIDKLGEKTHAYTAEDLVRLLDTACDIAEAKDAVAEELHPQPDTTHYLAPEDIEAALLVVRPTAMHDITLKPPSVRWEDIGGQDSIKKALRRAVETPMLHPERLLRLGATAKKGLLLYGPPGCSKTLSAQAMATEAGFNFFAVKGAELLNMYVGESERAVREIFARARAASPSIIFFDEIESIGSKRDAPGSRGNGVNVLTTLLNEMDGIETLKGVTILAATNQPEALDLALLRPGRFDQLLYVAPPDDQGRREILRSKLAKMDCEDDVDAERLVDLTKGHSGAELVGICQTACDLVLERCEDTGREERITMSDLVSATSAVKKQITPAMVRHYEQWARGLTSIDG